MNERNEDEVRVEAEFDAPVPPAAAWAALEQLRVERLDPDAAPETWWIPGFESRLDAVEVEPGQKLVGRKADEPCAGTTISLTFVHLPSGSRIHVVQSGFDPAFVRRAGEEFWAHASMLLAGVEEFFCEVAPTSP